MSRTRYDWSGALTGRYRWRGIYREMRLANPAAGRLKCAWWTLRFPHVHDENEELLAEVRTSNMKLQRAISHSGGELTVDVLHSASDIDWLLRDTNDLDAFGGEALTEQE